MAPFSISTHHSLPYRGRLTQETLFTKSKMSPELPSGKLRSSEDLPLVRYCQTSIVSLKIPLLQIFRRVANYCTKVVELFRSKMFFFICVGKTMAMMGASRKSEEEGLERPGVKDPEMVWMEEEEDDDEQESLVIESDEEEDEDDEDSQSERDLESNGETDEDEDDEEVESDWSDEEDDSEASAESLELWESFLNNGDPYNPLSFCSSTRSRAQPEQNQLTNPCKTQTKPDTRPEESRPMTSSKEGAKKVCFSDQVTVRPLVAWAFASRAARDGSCWLQLARDRERFRRRAESVEALLKPCLTPEHRASVWEKLQHKSLSHPHVSNSCSSP